MSNGISDFMSQDISVEMSFEMFDGKTAVMSDNMSHDMSNAIYAICSHV